MLHHRLQKHLWLVPLSLALAVASCDVSTSPGSWYVTYRVHAVLLKTNGLDSTAAIATIDSIYYSPGSGKCKTTCTADSTFVRVLAASATYSTELTVPDGGTLEAHLFGTGVAPGGTAKFAAIWMTATGSVFGDSVTATTTAGTHFTLDIAKQSL
ncbi:MAG TPA: hypothetical protein VEH83_04535 [Gemmatimonadales bacterium]|nr:hypothetical protein [Gemmatimonadales bacterium]